MNTQLKNLSTLLTLLAATGLYPPATASAQNFTNVYTFTGTGDGYNPQSTLLLSGSTLYGTVQGGGPSGGGSVFKVETNGTGYTTLYYFTGGSDGAYPQSGLILSSNILYGVTPYGGASSAGTVYAINTNGTGFTTLYSFTGGTDGANPYGGLVLSGHTLYGTTTTAGGATDGNIFSINTDGSGFTPLYMFTDNGDGSHPFGQLLLVGDTLYGTTQGNGNGTVFKVRTNGTSFVTLASFFGGPEGGSLYGGVVLSGPRVYGTTHAGGAYGYGNVFAVNTNATGFTNLHDFNGGTNGAAPYAGLLLSRGVLYGTTYGGSFIGNGTVFQISTNGTGFNTLYSFTGGADGSNPWGGLVQAGNTFYGTTYFGGGPNDGTVFSLTLTVPRPLLSIAKAGTNALLSWSTNFSGFVLQSTPGLVSPATWTNIATNGPIVNGQYTVTNAMTVSRKFYRLAQ